MYKFMNQAQYICNQSQYYQNQKRYFILLFITFSNTKAEYICNNVNDKPIWYKDKNKRNKYYEADNFLRKAYFCVKIFIQKHSEQITIKYRLYKPKMFSARQPTANHKKLDKSIFINCI